MLQQFNPMCRTVKVLWGERHVPWDIQERVSPVSPDTWCWRDEPPPTRRDYIVDGDMPCLYIINRLHNPRVITEPFTYHAPTARTGHLRSLYTTTTRTNNQIIIDCTLSS